MVNVLLDRKQLAISSCRMESDIVGRSKRQFQQSLLSFGTSAHFCFRKIIDTAEIGLRSA